MLSSSYFFAVNSAASPHARTLSPFCSTRAKMAGHTSREDIWMSISGKVYDVSKYLDDHPGGEEVLFDRAGKDATEDFEDVGHSNQARATLKKYEIGELPPSEQIAASTGGGGGGGGGAMAIVVPLLVVVAAAGYYFMTMGDE